MHKIANFIAKFFNVKSIKQVMTGKRETAEINTRHRFPRHRKLKGYWSVSLSALNWFKIFRLRSKPDETNLSSVRRTRFQTMVVIRIAFWSIFLPPMSFPPGMDARSIFG